MPDREQFLSQGGSLFVTLKRYRSSLILGGVGLVSVVYGLVDAVTWQYQVSQEAARIFSSPYPPAMLSLARDRLTYKRMQVEQLVSNNDYRAIQLIVTDEKIKSTDEDRAVLDEDRMVSSKRSDYFRQQMAEEKSEVLGFSVGRTNRNLWLAFGGISLMWLGGIGYARSRLKRSPNLGLKREQGTFKR